MRTNEAAIEHERIDHKHDEKPPKFAEATAPKPLRRSHCAEATAPNPDKSAAEAERTYPLPPETSDLPKHQRRPSAPSAIGAVAAVALPVLMWLVGRNRQQT
jgi:hypothetical protein